MFNHAIEVLEERITEIEGMMNSSDFVDELQNVVDMESQIDELNKAIAVLKAQQ